MSIQYTRESADSYAVWHDAHHRVGVVRKAGLRWLAITPDGRTLGPFTNMSTAGKRLIEEDENK